MNESPQLRGVVRSGGYSPGSFFSWSLYQNGLTDLWISVPPIKDRDTEPHDPAQIKLFHSEILGAVANSLSVIDHYRGYVGAPNSEYGVEIEIRTFYPDTLSVPEGPRMTPRKMLPPIIYYHDLLELGGPERSEMGTLRVLLPRLAVGSHSEFAHLLAVVDVDLYDALGIRRAPAVYPSLQVNI